MLDTQATAALARFKAERPHVARDWSAWTDDELVALMRGADWRSLRNGTWEWSASGGAYAGFVRAIRRDPTSRDPEEYAGMRYEYAGA